MSDGQRHASMYIVVKPSEDSGGDGDADGGGDGDADGDGEGEGDGDGDGDGEGDPCDDPKDPNPMAQNLLLRDACAKCGDKTYNTRTHHCCNGKVIQVPIDPDTGKPLAKSRRGCCGDQLYDREERECCTLTYPPQVFDPENTYCCSNGLSTTSYDCGKDWIALQFTVKINCPYVISPPHPTADKYFAGNTGPAADPFKVIQEIKVRIDQGSLVAIAPESYIGANGHAGGGGVRGGSGVAATGIKQEVSMTYGYNDPTMVSTYCAHDSRCVTIHGQKGGCATTASDTALVIGLRRISADEIEVIIQDTASDPCVFGACEISDRLTVRLRRRVLEDESCLIEYSLVGYHDWWPDRDFKINGTSTPVKLFPYDACKEKKSLRYLCNPPFPVRGVSSGGYIPLP